MIRESELLDAIKECHNDKNPDSKTCMKLASYYTILDHVTDSGDKGSYSHSEKPGQVRYDSGSEFSYAIRGMDIIDILDVVDELMDTISILSPRLYRATLEKLKNAFQ